MKGEVPSHEIVHTPRCCGPQQSSCLRWGGTKHYVRRQAGRQAGSHRFGRRLWFLRKGTRGVVISPFGAQSFLPFFFRDLRLCDVIPKHKTQTIMQYYKRRHFLLLLSRSCDPPTIITSHQCVCVREHLRLAVTNALVQSC